MSQPLIPLHVGGVPEHFNCPWWSAEEEGVFSELGIALTWHDCPGGTGEMMRSLAEGRLDLAVALTEGAIVAITQGTPARLLQWYVRSPLYWGIHVAHRSRYHNPAELLDARFAISRPGSGSHLMAYVLAQDQGWFGNNATPPKLNFVEVGNLSGGLKALSEERANVFLWERFTTQPWVDRGELRRVGLCPTPWPAFALVARTGLGTKQEQALERLSEHLARYASQYAKRPGVTQHIAQRCHLAQEQVAAWLELTHWADSKLIEKDEVSQILEQLKAFNLLPQNISAEEVHRP